MFLDLNQRYERPVLALAFNVWVDIRAQPLLVFHYLTQAEMLNRWWTTRCTSDARPGGELNCVWEGEQRKTGRAVFRQFEPPRRLVIEWLEANGERIRCDGTDPRGMRWPAITTYDLFPVSEAKTRLYVHDLGISAAPEFAAVHRATAEGWERTLRRLKKTVEYWEDKTEKRQHMAEDHLI